MIDTHNVLQAKSTSNTLRIIENAQSTSSQLLSNTDENYMLKAISNKETQKHSAPVNYNSNDNTYLQHKAHILHYRKGAAVENKDDDFLNVASEFGENLTQISHAYYTKPKKESEIINMLNGSTHQISDIFPYNSNHFDNGSSIILMSAFEKEFKPVSLITDMYSQCGIAKPEQSQSDNKDKAIEIYQASKLILNSVPNEYRKYRNANIVPSHNFDTITSIESNNEEVHQNIDKYQNDGSNSKSKQTMNEGYDIGLQDAYCSELKHICQITPDKQQFIYDINQGIKDRPIKLNMNPIKNSHMELPDEDIEQQYRHMKEQYIQTKEQEIRNQIDTVNANEYKKTMLRKISKEIQINRSKAIEEYRQNAQSQMLMAINTERNNITQNNEQQINQITQTMIEGIESNYKKQLQIIKEENTIHNNISKLEKHKQLEDSIKQQYTIELAKYKEDSINKLTLERQKIAQTRRTTVMDELNNRNILHRNYITANTNKSIEIYKQMKEAEQTQILTDYKHGIRHQAHNYLRTKASTLLKQEVSNNKEFIEQIKHTIENVKGKINNARNKQVSLQAQCTKLAIVDTQIEYSDQIKLFENMIAHLNRSIFKLKRDLIPKENSTSSHYDKELE